MVHRLAKPKPAMAGVIPIGIRGRGSAVFRAPKSADEGDDTTAIRGFCNAKWVVESLPRRPVLKKSSRNPHRRVPVQ